MSSSSYGTDWISYLKSGRCGCIIFCYYTADITEAICTTRNIVLQSRKFSEFPWVRNIAHCPEDVIELRKNINSLTAFTTFLSE